MHIYLSRVDSEPIYLEIDESGTIEDIKVIIEVEISIPIANQALFFSGKLLENSSRILENGIYEDAVLDLTPINSELRRQAIELISQYQKNPSYYNYLSQNNPALAEGVKTSDPIIIEEILLSTIQANKQHEIEQRRKEAVLDYDPLNPEYQRQIEQKIHQENINQNLEYAQEFMPEVFASVEMLYIDCKVNKMPLQAFVDSGAQNTIMSKECAQRVGIMRLVDTRFRGEARGVGVGTIIGRVHAANIEIGGKIFNCCFHVLEVSDIDLLFGLDMLKRHQCSIDLFKNKLVLNAGEIEVPFLSEGEVKHKRGKGGDLSPTKLEKQQSSEGENPIEGLMKLGFSQKDAEEAMKVCNGNPDLAASYLFQKMNFG
ncbi:unnamed protein product [Blepharisma stoltei]|uniref:DNA damage-inducible protein 1 n=1 Tax=Blepharisma stoltei TaxID=1481888 RepID=A0AAU9IM63_9CILI|nr:unnamed protein product [Blepharisma stoltei]